MYLKKGDFSVLLTKAQQTEDWQLKLDKFNLSTTLQFPTTKGN